MATNERNTLFEQKEYLIRRTMNRHFPLLRACRLDSNDVYQDLALCLLESLDRYDSGKCKNMDAYLTLRLKYRLLHMKDGSKRYGIPYAPRKGFSVLSLQATDRYGNEHEPADQNEYASPLWIEQEIQRLPPTQRMAINRLLAGGRISSRNKNLMHARSHLRYKLQLRQHMPQAV